MHIPFAGFSFRHRAAIPAALLLAVFALAGFAYQRSGFQVHYDANVTDQTRALVEALKRGEAPVPRIDRAEMERRRAYAEQRFGGADTDRGRFLICVGSPDVAESQGSAETWIYRTLGFSVVFINAAQNSTRIPPGVIPSRWFPLSDNCGIVLGDLRSRPGKSGVPTMTGIIMAKVHGSWTVIRPDAEVETIPLAGIAPE
jgi:hypothetical protein